MCKRLQAQDRLRRTSDFLAVRASGRKIVRRPFIMQVLMSTGGGSAEAGLRLGVIASKRVGGAVKRNRAKRLIRECFRSCRETLPAPCDLVVVARPAIDRLSFKELRGHFLEACDTIRKEADRAR